MLWLVQLKTYWQDIVNMNKTDKVKANVFRQHIFIVSRMHVIYISMYCDIW